MLRPGGEETYQRAVVEHRSFSLLFYPFRYSPFHPLVHVLFLQLPPGGESICLSFIRPPSSACQTDPSTRLGRLYLSPAARLVCALSLTCHNGARDPAGSGYWEKKKKKKASSPSFREAIRIARGESTRKFPEKLTAQRARHPGTRDQAHPFGASAARRREKDVKYTQGTALSSRQLLGPLSCSPRPL